MLLAIVLLIVGSGGVTETPKPAGAARYFEFEQNTDDDAAGDKKKPPLQWKRDRGQEVFDEGREAFNKNDFLQAKKEFKSALRLAKNDDTKEVCKSWYQASIGGIFLDRLEKIFEQPRKRPKVLGEAEEQFDRYRGTPIEARYQAFLKDKQGKLYHVLENFENVSKRYSKKYGKTFVDKPEDVREGRRAIRWKLEGPTAQLKVPAVPKDLSEFYSIVFWIKFEKGRPPYKAIFVASGRSNQNNQAVENIFFQDLKAVTKWTRVELPLAEFSVQGNASWDRIEDFKLYFEGNRKGELLVDQICLVKKTK